MNLVYGLITPTVSLLIGVIYAIVLIYSIFIIVKNEKSINALLWLIFALFIPFFGSLIYIARHFLYNKKNNFELNN
ncbi:Phospholipase_D-nuclease N-terminal [Psychroflexus salarius]|uniref:Phospholipase_D-nuclease N-terminal n=1 Tax=Psychroflexus salarius TaxID=1155689 RepID=A0A1M4T156_9FLAO|nr:Phospholipase_D-nuclease N-terminal [Psychroflexus salarius]